MSNSAFIDRSDIARDWHARGFSCGLWIDHAGREWTNQPRQTDELFMMMSGELELELEGQIIRPSVGEEIRIPAGTPHSIRNISKKTARWLYGQPREVLVVKPAPTAARERSFHPELKRKRRPEKIGTIIEVQKGP
ncbi:MAG: cupin domain-containing protein [Nitrospirales bacterium]